MFINPLPFAIAIHDTDVLEDTMNIYKGVLLLGITALIFSNAVLADGTEALGSPGISIESGTGVTIAGTGLLSSPGKITIKVPGGASVKQALLYWEGFMTSNVPGDNTISVSRGSISADITGTLIGGPTRFFSNAHASVFRADITSTGLVGPGVSNLTVENLSFNRASNGAGVLVIYDDGSSEAFIDVRDGSDLAYIDFANPLDGTVLQMFTFPPEDKDRTAMVNLFFASVSGTASGFGLRPTAIEIATGGSTDILPNLLDSIAGDEWDAFTIAVNVPSGASTLSVQPFSRDDLGTGLKPASFDWLAGAFAIQPEGDPGRMTGGGSVFTLDGTRVTRGFEIHCDLRPPNNLEVNWAKGQRFHLTQLTSAVCTDSPAITQEPPRAPFDTFTAEGTGLLKGVPGATIRFVFVDAGEPGVNDTAMIKIWAPGDNPDVDDPVLDVSGFLNKGNIQAHKDNQSTL